MLRVSQLKMEQPYTQDNEAHILTKTTVQRTSSS